MAATTTNEGKLDACCLKEYRPLAGIPSGQIIKISGIDCYYIAGKDETSKEKAIVLLTDVFGLVKNPRIIADDVAEKTGFDVYVPDMFDGEPIPTEFLKSFPEKPGEKQSIGSKLRLGGKFLPYAPWMFRHRQAVTLPLLEKFLTTLRNKRGVTKIQAVGYCFGGYYIMVLGGAQNRLVDAVVGCHISMTHKGQFEQIQVPVAVACAEEDNMFSNAARDEAQQILNRRTEIPSKFLLTKGTVHGFASRPNPDDPICMKGFEEANELIVEWAKTHL